MSSGLEAADVGEEDGQNIDEGSLADRLGVANGIYAQLQYYLSCVRV